MDDDDTLARWEEQIARLAPVSLDRFPRFRPDGSVIRPDSADPPADPPSGFGYSPEEMDRWVQANPGWKPDDAYLEKLWANNRDDTSEVTAQMYQGWTDAWDRQARQLEAADAARAMFKERHRYMEAMRAPWHHDPEAANNAARMALEARDAGEHTPKPIEKGDPRYKSASYADQTAAWERRREQREAAAEPPPPPKDAEKSMAPKGSGSKSIREKNTWQALIPIEQQIREQREAAAKKALEGE